jgi:uncharacterized protein (DUF1501 family)
MSDKLHFNRRDLVRLGGLGLTTALPFATQFAAMGAAASTVGPSDYKALVCMFWYGGNDSNNTVLATDADSWSRYWLARNAGADPIALMPVGTKPVPVGQISPITGRTVTKAVPDAWGGVLPFAPKTPQAIPAGTKATSAPRTFAVHPFLAPILPLYSAGRLAVLANVGTLIQPTTKAQYAAKSVSLPVNLYSHNDQQSEWQAGRSEGATTGYGGLIADNEYSLNTTNGIFTAISTSGNAVFLSGQTVVQYQVSTNAQPAVLINGATASNIDGSSLAPQTLQSIITDTTPASNFQSDYAAVVARSLKATGILNGAMSSAVVTALPVVPTYTNQITGNTETNSLAVQLATVARIIAASQALGVKRQVFFISMSGFDTHDTQNADQPNNLGKIAQAMTYFDTALSNVGGADYRPNVTLFTASDFSRTFTTNGDGTDHAWGGHHFILGGAVKGGDMYGQYPTLGVDNGAFNNPNMVGNALIPTTSVDQYIGTLGRWFGVSDEALNTIFPNLKNFPGGYLNFI